jgi:hypothetical protein
MLFFLIKVCKETPGWFKFSWKWDEFVIARRIGGGR